MKKEKKSINPVTISEDIWFYPLDKKLDFTVYATGRQPVLFSISKKKLAKYLSEDLNK